MSSTLDISRSRHVARVYLNRPDVRNAFNDSVIAELNGAFTQLGTDSELRVIVLGGHGKAFCAGADLGWMRAMADYTWEENRADAQALADMLWSIYRCPVPIVGRIHGDCYAGGVGLALAKVDEQPDPRGVAVADFPQIDDEPARRSVLGGFKSLPPYPFRRGVIEAASKVHGQGSLGTALDAQLCPFRGRVL